MKRRGEFSAFGDAEILPLSELLLEREQLLRREGCPGLSVGLVLPEIALDFGGLSVFCKKKKEAKN